MVARTFWLSFHAAYECRHAGACCSSGWAIPVERVRTAALDTLDVRGWLRPAAGAPDDVAGVLATGGDGQCVFYGGPRTPRCRAHEALGHAALPSACQHFPRECLIDARGVFVTLSHYCPTAAELLFTHTGRAEIVAGPPVVRDGPAEGFDARGALPPLLAPGILMDPDGYGAWEAHMVRTLAGHADASDPRAPEASIARLERDARTLSRWTPGRGALVDAVAAVGGENAPASGDIDWDEERRLFDAARASVPSSYAWPALPLPSDEGWARWAAAGWPEHGAVVGRYLAAHAFASWMAYQGNGVRSLIRRLRTALAVLRAEVVRTCAASDRKLVRSDLAHSIRQADLLLVHLADREFLAARLATPAA